MLDPGPLALRIGSKAGDIIREVNRRQLRMRYNIDEYLGENNRLGEILIQRGSHQIMLRF